MRILCTVPGKHGDSLWAMPTVRAISEAAGAPVDFATSPKYAGILSLLQAQEYVEETFSIDAWEVQETAPMTPWRAPYPAGAGELYDRTVHLGYRAWPDRPLPQCIYAQTEREYPDLKMAPLDLGRPWITATPAVLRRPIAVGFTDEWFELKVGLMHLLDRALATVTAEDDEADVEPDSYLFAWWPSAYPGNRWEREVGCLPRGGWVETAEDLAAARLFLGDCSALHVLACALGIPCVLMEPAEARWNDIFYPYGKHGPQVTLVHGNDGRPTFDARHVRDTIEAKLKEIG